LLNQRKLGNQINADEIISWFLIHPQHKNLYIKKTQSTFPLLFHLSDPVLQDIKTRRKKRLKCLASPRDDSYRKKNIRNKFPKPNYKKLKCCGRFFKPTRKNVIIVQFTARDL
jgi:hypothetical protein